MRFYIGVDGGGTKTELAAITDQGRMLVKLSGKSTNPYAVNFAAAMEELDRLLDEIIRHPATNGLFPGSLCLGMAGVDTPAERQNVLDSLKRYQERRNLAFPILLQSEAEISLMAALDRKYGILVVSGTGSITYGLTADGKRYRAGGWGHLLGDEGSGYSIGLNSLKAAMKCYDGALPSTMLVPMILEKYRFSEITELKAYVYGKQIAKSDIAAFAEICIKACGVGDETALRIIRGEAEQLAQTTAALIRKNPAFASSDVVLTGSVFRHSAAFRHIYQTELAGRFPELRFPNMHAGRSAAEGAALIAREMTHIGM